MGEESAAKREGDLVLNPNEYIYILDATKGNVICYVGPYKTSLAQTDMPVVFEEKNKKFMKSDLKSAIQQQKVAPENWYVILKNPSSDANNIHPAAGHICSLPNLEIGKKVIIPGPTAFTPWPGQIVNVLEGHLLRSNQYLVVKIYDEESAKANWKSTFLKTADEKVIVDPPNFKIGEQFIIKGTEVSFFIPATGMEVVKDSAGNYVRNAVTLEQLEYCILLSESGEKTFIHGPNVVFPLPTQKFVEKRDGDKVKNKFKAIELTKISGIYVKVIAPYEESGVKHTIGEELFITGEDIKIYWPRAEHAIINYGKNTEIIYSVAIPKGEGRYVLDRVTGEITLECGPKMLLLDPREKVFIKRILDKEMIKLLYPDNKLVENYNESLSEVASFMLKDNSAGYIPETTVDSYKSRSIKYAMPTASNSVVGDKLTRQDQFTTPRTLTLNTKLEGAVGINIWSGYAILITNKTGGRKVVSGPSSVLLEYDETVEPVVLSTKTPKTDEFLLKTAYLRVANNKVSDLVKAETSDFCKIDITLSYRVNFEGEPSNWFSVENYVKYLTDHLRSVIKNIVKKTGIKEFYNNYIQILRDGILGFQIKGKRPGMIFPENGMKVFDVEILNMEIGDKEIAQMLSKAEKETIEQTLLLKHEENKKNADILKNEMNREVSKSNFDTQAFIIELQRVKNKLEAEKAKEVYTFEKEEAIHDTEILDEKLKRKTNEDMQALNTLAIRLNQEKEKMAAETQAVREKLESIPEGLIEVIQKLGDESTLQKLTESMAPLAILGGKSVSDVVANLLAGTKAEDIIKSLKPKSK